MPHSLLGIRLPARVSRLLAQREAVLIFGLATGMLLGPKAAVLRQFIIPLLFVVMTVAAIGFFSRIQRVHWRGVFWGGALNYGLLGGFFLAASTLFPPYLRPGVVLLAFCPPAVAIVPFSYAFEGDEPMALSGTLGATLMALALMPLGGWLFLDAPGSVPALIETAILLIVLPLGLGYALAEIGAARYVAPYRSHMTNWSFCILTITMVGANRAELFPPSAEVAGIALMSAASCLGPGVVVALIARWRGWSWSTGMSALLLGTLKNYAVAGGLALQLFDDRAALPPASGTVVMVSLVILFGFTLRHLGIGPGYRKPRRM